MDDFEFFIEPLKFNKCTEFGLGKLRSAEVMEYEP